MQLFISRWPNGDFSLIYAKNKAHALSRLTYETPEAEPWPLFSLNEFIAHFRLTDEGAYELKEIDRGTAVIICHIIHLSIRDAWLNGPGNADPSIETLRKAVKKERTRLPEESITEPETDIGKRIKNETGLPTKVVDEMVRKYARKTLKKLKPSRVH